MMNPLKEPTKQTNKQNPEFKTTFNLLLDITVIVARLNEFVYVLNSQ